MTKLLTAVSCAVFLWVFWNVSLSGVYVGTYTSVADGQPQCRYMTARGLFDEDRAEAVAARSKSSKWCPTTYIIGRDKGAHLKPGIIGAVLGL